MAWIAATSACARLGPADWNDALRRQAAALEQALAQDASESLPPDAARVRLAFGTGADLDLYVTDPLTESLYFANTPIRSGGELDADQTCDDPAPRVETALFSPASPGRYRVGVDFMTRCQRGAARVPFAVEVLSDGLRRLERGLIDFGHFEPLVLQFDVEPR